MAIETTALPLVSAHAAYAERPTAPAAGTEDAGGIVFEQMLKSMAVSANERIHEAQAAGEAFAAGQRDDIHGTMLALSKADIELRVVGNVRNRIIDAFYEVWRMQI